MNITLQTATVVGLQYCSTTELYSAIDGSQ